MYCSLLSPKIVNEKFASSIIENVSKQSHNTQVLRPSKTAQLYSEAKMKLHTSFYLNLFPRKHVSCFYRI